MTATKASSSRGPRRDPSLSRFTVIALSTMTWDRSRRPLLAEGSTFRRISGATASVLETSSTVTVAVVSN